MTTTNIYKVQMSVECTEEGATAMRKSLAQAVYDEFELSEQCAVFGVNIELSVLPKHQYVMALHMVELEDGLEGEQVNRLLSVLPDGRKYMPIEFHENNTSAYGFVDSEYYQIHDYTPGFITSMISDILDDQKLESSDGIYTTPDGKKFYMD